MFIKLTGVDSDDRPYPIFVNPTHVDMVRPFRTGSFVGFVGSPAIRVQEQIDEVMALLQGAEVRHA
ncbi:MAG: hypothetical protein ACM3ZA_10265 [Bacillota bacterium]